MLVGSSTVRSPTDHRAVAAGERRAGGKEDDMRDRAVSGRMRERERERERERTLPGRVAGPARSVALRAGGQAARLGQARGGKEESA
jgi:hypothetical protein